MSEQTVPESWYRDLTASYRERGEEIERLLARVVALEEAARNAVESLVEAQREASHGLTANGQVIDQYVTAAAIDLRAVLDTGKRETSGKDVHHDGRGTASTQ